MPMRHCARWIPQCHGTSAFVESQRSSLCAVSIPLGVSAGGYLSLVGMTRPADHGYRSIRSCAVPAALTARISPYAQVDVDRTTDYLEHGLEKSREQLSRCIQTLAAMSGNWARVDRACRFNARTSASLRASVIASAPLCFRFGVTPIYSKASLGRPKVRKFLQARGALERNRSNPSLSVRLPHRPAARTRFQSPLPCAVQVKSHFHGRSPACTVPSPTCTSLSKLAL